MSFHTDIEAIEVKDPQERAAIMLDHLKGNADDELRAEREDEDNEYDDED